MKQLVLLVLITFFIAGCSFKPDYAKFENVSKGNFEEVEWEHLQGFHDDDLDLAFHTFKKGCEKARNSLKNVCSKVDVYQNPEKFFKDNFVPFKIYSEDDVDTGLITGYYEPLLYGSRTKTDKYKYPIYKTPEDLLTIDLGTIYPELKRYRLRGRVVGNKVIPYHSRAQMSKQKDMEVIAYVDDKIDLFFLQIQGSGRVKLDSAEIINVGYANQNGRAYYAIGRALINKGYIKKEDISLQSIRAWLEANPDQQDEILNLNQSYVFFKESELSATGSLGVELIGERNLAVDRKFIPLGYPVFINTQNPQTKEPIDRLMVAADTGGAIKGEVRADFFWGYGEKAEKLAGLMKEEGKLYILIPKEISTSSK